LLADEDTIERARICRSRAQYSIVTKIDGLANWLRCREQGVQGPAKFVRIDLIHVGVELRAIGM